MTSNGSSGGVATDVRLVVESANSDIDGIIIKLSQWAGQPARNELAMAVFARTFHPLWLGSLVVGEDASVFVDGVLPDGVKMAMNAVGYPGTPPDPAELNDVLAAPFDVQFGEGSALLVGASSTVTLVVDS